MSEAQNTQVIKDAYTAFARGDVKAILDSLGENVVWQGIIGTEGVLPQSGVRRGRRRSLNSSSRSPTRLISPRSSHRPSWRKATSSSRLVGIPRR